MACDVVVASIVARYKVRLVMRVGERVGDDAGGQAIAAHIARTTLVDPSPKQIALYNVALTAQNVRAAAARACAHFVVFVFALAHPGCADATPRLISPLPLLRVRRSASSTGCALARSSAKSLTASWRT